MTACGLKKARRTTRYGFMPARNVKVAKHLLQQDMWANLEYFLKAVVPAAEKAGGNARHDGCLSNDL